MADIKGLLTDKVGPLPGWAWLLVGGGTLYFVLPKLTGGSSTATAGPSPTDASAANIAGYQSGFAQGAQAYPPAAPAAPGGPKFARLTGYSGSGKTTNPNGANLFRNPGDPKIARTVPAGTYVQVIGSPVSVSYPDYPDLTSMVPVIYQGQQFYAFTPQVEQGGPGTGGGGRRGSRSADPMAYFHPAMKRKPRYTHWTRAGAPADIAQQIGVHPARLMMLNDPGHANLRPGTRIA